MKVIATIVVGNQSSWVWFERDAVLIGVYAHFNVEIFVDILLDSINNQTSWFELV